MGRIYLIFNFFFFFGGKKKTDKSVLEERIVKKKKNKYNLEHLLIQEYPLTPLRGVYFQAFVPNQTGNMVLSSNSKIIILIIVTLVF